MQEFLKVGLGFERLFFFVLVFFLGMHIAACMWLIAASFSASEDIIEDKIYMNYDDTWISSFPSYEPNQLYTVSMYWAF